MDRGERTWWREKIHFCWWFYDFQAFNVCWWPIYYVLYDPLWIDYKLTTEHALSHSPLYFRFIVRFSVFGEKFEYFAILWKITQHSKEKKWYREESFVCKVRQREPLPKDDIKYCQDDTCVQFTWVHLTLPPVADEFENVKRGKTDDDRKEERSSEEDNDLIARLRL